MPPQMTTTFRTKSFNRGQYIFKEGQEGSYACIIHSGTVQVSRTIDGEEVVLAELGRGAVFGEMALIATEKRTATVTAVDFTEVVVVDRGRLFKALESSNPLVQALVRGLVERLASTNALVRQQQQMTDNLRAMAYLLQAWSEANPPDEYGRVRLPLSKLVDYSKQTLHLPAPDMEQIVTALADSDILQVERGAQGRELVLTHPDHVVRRTEYLAERLENLSEQDQTEQGDAPPPPPETAPPAPQPSRDRQEDVVDIYELAKRAGVSPHDVCQRLAAGELPKTMVFFRREPALAWAKEHKGQGGADVPDAERGPLSTLEEVLLADRKVLIKALAGIGTSTVETLLAGGSDLSRRIIAKHLSERVRSGLPADLSHLSAPAEADFRRAVEQLAAGVRMALGSADGGLLRER